MIAQLVKQEVDAGLQTLVWTIFNAESDILSEELAKLGIEHDLLTGRSNRRQRAESIDRFVHGKSMVLISRASMLGYGKNFQCCGSMIFSAWNDSYEAFYQAVRRAFRDGQTKRLRVHLPICEELERETLDNILNKEAEHEAGIAEMETNYIAASKRLRLVA